ncbi:YchF/TatD family DNA exonuclease [Alkalibaculum sp. M08DMB]|uniref:YchF/TatD family DNA exonuclease n=1 Tax=Alkalibaculum sporogenes TaxID=2655001 RepID=A0A6A7K859_9FIRM|nr:TatD family hydrolase [Alkalibaculum sporogenes]MPW25283.1 YchF/TatD family DNA exonuclease [Alkalibaculum sporogenes]
MLIDTHAHMNDDRYKDNLDEIINLIKKEKMTILINPGVDLETSISSIELAEKYDFIYAAVGYHPHEAKDATEEKIEKLDTLTDNKKVVAIGEIGLDYYYEYSPKNIQKKVFEAQIDLAKKRDLPIIVHSRDAHQDTYNILKNNSNNLRGVLHSYSGSWELAKRYLDIGFYISLSGPITFKNAHKLPEIAVKVPKDRILIETDSPYLTPVPYRGKTNNPIYVKYIAQEICKLREVDIKIFMNDIKKNTLELFDKIVL